MTWTLAVFDFKGEPPPARASFEAAGYTPPVMGSRATIQNAISSVWDGINWQALDIFLERSDVAIKIYLAPHTASSVQSKADMISCVLLNVGYGAGTNPYPYLEALCEATGWTVYDTEINAFLQFPNPNQAGLNAMQDKAARTLGERQPFGQS
ncbi:MAG: hypothetical protein AAF267_10415 [Deinococcota bacterium]